MQTSTSRLNNITMLGCILLLTMCGINYLHGRLIYDPQPDVKMQVLSIPTFTQTKKWDQLGFRYNLDASNYEINILDLSSLYTWNLKQLYVYIQVEWDSPKNLHNRAILSDWILQAPKDRKKVLNQWVIKAKDKPLEYLFRDVHHSLRSSSVKLSLNVQYMPIVGIFSKTRLYENTIKLPSEYVQK